MSASYRLQFLTLAIFIAVAAPLGAQGKPPTIDDLLGTKSSALGAGEGDLDISASITPAAGNKPAELTIATDIPDGWHTFSITQPAGGPTGSIRIRGIPVALPGSLPPP